MKVDLQNPNIKEWGIALLVISLPFFLNDIFYINWRGDPSAIFVVDYLCRIWYLAFAFYFFRENAFRLTSSIAPLEKRDVLIDYVLFMIVIFVTYKYGYKFCQFLVYAFKVSKGFSFRYPPAINIFHKSFDLTVGLMLVAFTEELIFRRYVYSFFAYVTKKAWFAIIAQAFLFAIGHFAAGTASVLDCFWFGLLTGAFYHYKKDLRPLIFAHFLTDFLLFI